MKKEAWGTFFIVAVLVGAGIGVASVYGGLPVPFTESTSTTTLTFPCSTSNSTQGTESGPGGFPDYGPLLGNLSAVSIVEREFSPLGNISVTDSLSVLNRTSSGPVPEYLVNVTMTESGANTSEVSVNDGLTTTTTISGTQVQIGSALGLVVPNGTMVSLLRSSGSSLASGQTSAFPLSFFSFMAVSNLSSSIRSFHQVNSTVVTIGTNRMVVTDYLLPALDIVEVQQGCGSSPSNSSTAGTFSDEVLQAGQVPGSRFTLVTQFSETILFAQVYSSTSKAVNASVTLKVTSFSLA